MSIANKNSQNQIQRRSMKKYRTSSLQKIIHYPQDKSNKNTPKKNKLQTLQQNLISHKSNIIKHNKTLSALTMQQKILSKEKNSQMTGINFKSRNKTRSNIASYRNKQELPQVQQSKDNSINDIRNSSQNKPKKKDSFLKSRLKAESRNTQRTNSNLNPLSIDSKKSIPDQILDYIKKRQDEYKKQFFTKSKMLQQYIYNSKEPDKIKNTYLNQGDSHFINGLEGVMLKLFRNGTIVPQSYNNLRQQAVDQIQKWVIGWIHRKINYARLGDEEEDQINIVDNILGQMSQWRKQLYEQDTSF